MNSYEDPYNRQIYFDLCPEEDTWLAVKQVDDLDLVKLLDIARSGHRERACGYRRHATELGHRGFRGRGIDLVSKQIGEAKSRASEPSIEIEFQ